MHAIFPTAPKDRTGEACKRPLAEGPIIYECTNEGLKLFDVCKHGMIGVIGVIGEIGEIKIPNQDITKESSGEYVAECFVPCSEEEAKANGDEMIRSCNFKLPEGMVVDQKCVKRNNIGGEPVYVYDLDTASYDKAEACSNGCKDGACIELPQKDIELPQKDEGGP